MTDESVQPKSSSPPTKRRLVILCSVLGLIFAAGFSLVHTHLIYDQGFLPTSQEYGYGYRSLRAVTWNSYNMRTERPVFLILWKTKQPPVFEEGVGIPKINGHDVWPSQSTERKSIYALQPNYTLRRLDLSDKGKDLAFAAVDKARQYAAALQTEFWQTRIDPELAFVESAPATQPEPAEPTDAQ